MLKSHVIAFGINCFAFGVCIVFAIAEFMNGTISDAIIDIVIAVLNIPCAIWNASKTSTEGR